MSIVQTKIPEVIQLEPQVFRDDRGFFFEAYNDRKFAQETGIIANFVQDNHSYSKQNVLRGLHYQIQQPQGKLVRAIVGTIFDVAVDIRKSSTTFGKWVGYELSADNKRLLWIPPGFAHGFLVLSEIAEVLYKTTDYYAPQGDRTILWNDPDLAIDWPLSAPPILSTKDEAGKPLRTAEVFD
ncbi:MAG TPA: dTDP-4-dehydrorhamnose 3,5-epimerase [Nostoc sp.]|uniref:dTDP-4-dehydrorhamnose 3,5-epimerase n=1 Tax=Nostoc sp. TaxID=1180 RepID=UPI002D67EE6A|nr:dTDP-4-dehydrorhamnose 3,5-epimerase [Nostoc sp.]HYX18162.1 dTDP-4-dehydrorhamnose 3,5-epimerase [Nostoc sp.]